MTNDPQAMPSAAERRQGWVLVGTLWLTPEHVLQHGVLEECYALSPAGAAWARAKARWLLAHVVAAGGGG